VMLINLGEVVYTGTLLVNINCNKYKDNIDSVLLGDIYTSLVGVCLFVGFFELRMYTDKLFPIDKLSI
jgi:hypothetical protein